ncbi:MAG: hypothetical protein ABJF23_25350 [Bryobacteraceae bacterium]
MKIGRILILAAFGVICACNKAPQTKDAVKQGVVEHLGKGAGLDLAAMDVEVTAVSFADNQAKATVSFRPKSNPDQGMTMNYTLEPKGNKWVVLKKAGNSSSPHGDATVAPPAPAGDLPPGHPPVSPAPK